MGAGDGRYLARAGLVTLVPYVPLALLIGGGVLPGAGGATSGLVLLWIAFAWVFMAARGATTYLRPAAPPGATDRSLTAFAAPPVPARSYLMSRVREVEGTNARSTLRTGQPASTTPSGRSPRAEDPTRRLKDARRSARGNDVDLEGGHDVGVQAHGGAVAAGRLDRRHDLDLATVDGGATGSLDASARVAVVTAPKRRPLSPAVAETVTTFSCSQARAVWACSRDSMERLRRASVIWSSGAGALGPRGGQLAGQEVVTGVAVLDLHDLAGGAEVGDVVR